MKLVLLHGWAFDTGVWHNLAPMLPAREPVLADRGYFGEPCRPRPLEPHVIIAHSLGAMQALLAPGAACKGLVAINGFDCFTARDGNAGVAVRVLDRMVSRMDKDSNQVVADFRAQCGAPAPGPIVHPDVLMDDLRFLRDGDCRSQCSGASFPILSLHGDADPILPRALREVTFATAGELHREVSKDGGHLLPLTHARWCADRIVRFLGAVA